MLILYILKNNTTLTNLILYCEHFNNIEKIHNSLICNSSLISLKLQVYNNDSLINMINHNISLIYLIIPVDLLTLFN